MLEYATFEHFAKDLMFFRSNFNNEAMNRGFIEPIPLMDSASFVKYYFADGHCEHFSLIFEKNEYQDLQNDEQFLRYTIPRCLNLIDEERCFYSIMLVSGFLADFVYKLEEVRKCNRFHYTAYKCLIAVFKRALEDSFDAEGGFKGLEKYMKEIEKTMYSESFKYIIDHLNQGSIELREKVIRLIENCDDFSDESFHLNDYELSLIRDDDDVKNAIELLDSDNLNEDPLNLKWPPPPEEIQKVLKLYETRLANYEPKEYPVVTRLFDSCRDDESDSDSDSDLADSLRETREFTDLYKYMLEICSEARDRYGPKLFHEKMKLRKCPCCGIKCYQFSNNMYLKQLDSALIIKIPKWKIALREFISSMRYKISRCFNPVILYK